jgi:hypothetical protein
VPTHAHLRGWARSPFACRLVSTGAGRAVRVPRMADRSPRSIQNPESGRRALREFDEVGREAFLAKYDVWSAKKFELVDEGQVYDAKVVLATAFAHEFPGEAPLSTTELDGNDATVRRNVERLGFRLSVLGHSSHPVPHAVS